MHNPHTHNAQKYFVLKTKPKTGFATEPQHEGRQPLSLNSVSISTADLLAFARSLSLAFAAENEQRCWCALFAHPMHTKLQWCKIWFAALGGPERNGNDVSLRTKAFLLFLLPHRTAFTEIASKNTEQI